MTLMASLWINQRIKVKQQLELLFRGIIGKIYQTIQFSDDINILQKEYTNFSRAFGSIWDSKF